MRRKRICGEIKGKLDQTQPFLFLAHVGAWTRESRASNQETLRGIYVVNVAAGNGFCPKTGVILPLSRCRNDQLRGALRQLHGMLAEKQVLTDITAHYDVIRSFLAPHFGDALKIAYHRSLTGFVEFETTQGLFSLLAENFEYVTEFDDDPSGAAEPTAFLPFSWKSYGEFLEWFYSKAKSEERYWEHCQVFLVFGETGLLDERWSFGPDVTHPNLNLGKFFSIRPEIENEKVHVKFEMASCGWAYLHLVIGDMMTTINLSYAYPPFEDLLEWIKRVSRNDVPVQVDIDEEGPQKQLVVFSTESAERVFLRVYDPYEEQGPVVEAIVSRSELVEAIKAEFLRFFSEEFLPEKWDSEEAVSVPLRESILADSWLSL